MQTYRLMILAGLVLAIQTGCGGKTFNGTGTAGASQSSASSSTTATPAVSPTTTSTQPIGTDSSVLPNPPAASMPAPVSVPPNPPAASMPAPVPTPVDPPAASMPAPVVQGNSIAGSVGQTLSFFNGRGRIVGAASGSVNGGNIQVQLLNTFTGRKATVSVSVDPNSGAFTAVSAVTAQPYMCHDPDADPCAIFPDATTNRSEINCESPIYFRGSLVGSVNGLTTPASDQCLNQVPPIVLPIVPVPMPGPVPCQITTGSGQVVSANEPSKELCQVICRSYASDSTACSFNGQAISPAF